MTVRCPHCGKLNPETTESGDERQRCGSCRRNLAPESDGEVSTVVGLVGGAALGAAAGGPVGALVGAVLGAVIGKSAKGVG